MKTYLSILVGLILVPVLAFAANDAVFSGGNLSVGGYTLTLNGTVDSVTANTDSFDATLTAGQSLRVTSTDLRKLVVDPMTYVKVDRSCNSSESTITISTTNDSGSFTITVTPSATYTCSSDGGGGVVSSGGGGGGGGGGGSTVAAPAKSSTQVTPSTTTSIPAKTLTAPAISSAFNKDLGKGSRSDDVKRLQQLLASDKSIYPEGTVSGYFGPLTVKAITQFQLKYGVIKSSEETGAGRLGPKTRAKVSEVFGVSTSSSVSSTASDDAKKAVMQTQILQLQSQINALLLQLQKAKSQ
ncbi:MAG: hypothetical protein Athens071426_146 [Parcubacteria group bacterium Athens0714_26]|nr:MAG: hypothetical protein Athens101426_58 [Parcubacteria group bacterium Athens1014_26]TSD03657.1 MAG: hypothetical protein Athens071426_146 [Parcubacteria group bacterium Athens0714_26]